MTDVLVVHNVLWAHYKGGVFTCLSKQAKDNGLQVQFVHIAETEKSRGSLREGDASVHQYAYRVLFSGAYERTSLVRRCARLLAYLLRARPRVVLITGYSDPAIWVVWMACLLLRSKIVVAVDSQWSDKPRHWLREMFKRLFVRRCHMGFTYGTKSKEYLQRLGMPEERIIVRVQATLNDEISSIYQKALVARELAKAEIGLGRRNFVYVGRLAAEKNLELLVRALASARSKAKTHSDWGLLVVGDGAMREPMRHLGFALNVPITFVGAQTWRNVPRYLALADVLVLPSLSEPWGLVVNEAMVCSMPVVVSDRCGAAHDLVRHGINGYVFDASSQSQLTDFLITTMDADDAELAKMGIASQTIIKDYTPEAAAAQMMSGFFRLLGKSTIR